MTRSTERAPAHWRPRRGEVSGAPVVHSLAAAVVSEPAGAESRILGWHAHTAPARRGPSHMPQRPDRTEDGSQLSANGAMYLDDLSDPSGCTLVPNSVLDDDQLGPETRLVYIMLRRVAAAGDGQPVDQRELAGIGVPRS